MALGACTVCLITWSHALIMTAGSELGKQLSQYMLLVSGVCMFIRVIMCILRSLWYLHNCLWANWAAVEVNGLLGLGCTSSSVESVYEFASVWQEGSNVPWGPQALLTLLQHQFNHWLVHVWHEVGCRWWAVAMSEGLWMCSGDILTKSVPIN